MVILDYKKSKHKEIIQACVKALLEGKVVAYPTDTSYGLAADAANEAAVKKLYKIKERGFNKPVHVVVPSKSYGKKIVAWNSAAEKLSKTFWPGPLTLVLPLKSKNKVLKKMTGGTGNLGLRYPRHKIALDLPRFLNSPITATSANPSAHLSSGYDSYSATDVIAQFEKMDHKPDIVIDAGTLPRRKPSTLVKIEGNKIQILRQGPVSDKKIRSSLSTGS